MESETLEGLLDDLNSVRLDYVIERSKTRSNRAALRLAGISEATFYCWSDEDREHLNEVALQLRRHYKLAAIRILQRSAKDAAQVKVSGLHSRKEHIKQDAATEILNRIVGKPAQKHELGGEDGEQLTITIKYDSDKSESSQASS